MDTRNPCEKLATLQRHDKSFGMADAYINGLVANLTLDKKIHIGYYPVFPEVHLSLTVRTSSASDPGPLFAEACQAIEQSLGEVIYGRDQDSLASITGQLLKDHHPQLAVAESCTGGLLGQLVTRVAGSSSYFLGGVIAYANSMKTEYLDVSEQLLASHGAVSREVAAAMAVGVMNRSKADIAVAVTGLAGPGGGSKEKPVGTVYISVATKSTVHTQHFQFVGNRAQIQKITAKTALDLVRQYLLKQNGS